MRLSRAALDHLPAGVERPAPAPVATGIVHLGLSAFHRAHQAAYIDTLLRHDPRWGIAAVSLRSGDVAAALRAQDGLYTLALRGPGPGWRVIGAHTMLLGPDEGARGLAWMARPEVALVTTTVTEKGYCFDAEGALDLTHPDIAGDLAGGMPSSAIGWLVAGLAARRAAGGSAPAVMPCDNLPANGRKLKAGLVAFARAGGDAGLADWIAGEVPCPSTMVDAITPATDAVLRADVEAATGLADAAPVQREPFAQWVIEDVGQVGPDLAGAGAIVTNDVAAYERAKLRILNGSHSTLAYLGLLRGHATVAEAMSDANLARFVGEMIADEIAPSLPPAAGLDLGRYAGDVLDRFRNPGIVHRLEQIAQDGSQKLPYRLGDTLVANRAGWRMPRRVVAAIGCWVAFLMRQARAGKPIIDPAADLAALASEGSAAEVVARLAARGIGIPPTVSGDPALLRAIEAAASAADTGDWQAIISG